MTPRQVMAFMIVAGRRIRHEKAQDLNLTAIASQAPAKNIKSTTDQLLSER